MELCSHDNNVFSEHVHYPPKFSLRLTLKTNSLSHFPLAVNVIIHSHTQLTTGLISVSKDFTSGHFIQTIL